jgi:hypothetical protein
MSAGFLGVPPPPVEFRVRAKASPSTEWAGKLDVRDADPGEVKEDSVLESLRVGVNQLDPGGYTLPCLRVRNPILNQRVGEATTGNPPHGPERREGKESPLMIEIKERIIEAATGTLRLFKTTRQPGTLLP